MEIVVQIAKPPRQDRHAEEHDGPAACYEEDRQGGSPT
jgi:hypothetical protein